MLHSGPHICLRRLEVWLYPSGYVTPGCDEVRWIIERHGRRTRDQSIASFKSLSWVLPPQERLSESCHSTPHSDQWHDAVGVRLPGQWLALTCPPPRYVAYAPIRAVRHGAHVAMCRSWKCPRPMHALGSAGGPSRLAWRVWRVEREVLWSVVRESGT